jgi:hypothetical protein
MSLPISICTPTVMTPAIRDFIAELTPEQPLIIPVFAADGARLGRSARNVRLSIKERSGSICHGWRISACDLWLEADFHAVKVTPLGMYVDVTPSETGDNVTLFAPDRKFGKNFDFLKRPKNRRRRIYDPSGGRLETTIASFSARRMDYERRKAATVGLLLPEWIARRDPLALAIDEYLRIAGELDEIFVPDHKGSICSDSKRLLDVRTRMERSQRRLSRLLGGKARVEAVTS